MKVKTVSNYVYFISVTIDRAESDPHFPTQERFKKRQMIAPFGKRSAVISIHTRFLTHHQTITSCRH